MTPASNIFDELEPFIVNGQEKQLTPNVAKALKAQGYKVDSVAELKAKQEAQAKLDAEAKKAREIADQKKTRETKAAIAGVVQPRAVLGLPAEKQRSEFEKQAFPKKQAAPVMLQGTRSIKSAKTPEDEQQIFQQALLENTDKEFVKRYMSEGTIALDENGNDVKIEPLFNEDGTTSTHEMVSFDNKVAPTIINKNGKLERLDTNEAIEYALSTGEFIEFPDEQTAQAFAENGYKQVQPKVLGDKIIKAAFGTEDAVYDTMMAEGESLLPANRKSKHPELQEAQEWVERRNSYAFGKDFSKFLTENSVYSLQPDELRNLTKLQKRLENQEGGQIGLYSKDQMLAEYEWDVISEKVEDAYLAYLEKTRPKLAENMKSKLSYIRDLQAKGQLQESGAYRTYLEDVESFRTEALNAYHAATASRIANVHINYDLKEYEKGAAYLNAEIAKLDKAVAAAGIDFSQPIPPAKKEAAAKIQAQGKVLQEQMELLKERTGVTEEVIAELDTQYKNLTGLQAASSFVYRGNVGDKAASQVYKDDNQDKALAAVSDAQALAMTDEEIDAINAEFGTNIEKPNIGSRVFNAMGRTVLTMATGTLKLPKVMGDMVGDTDFDNVDKLYNYSEGIRRAAAPMNYTQTQEYMSLPTIKRLPEMFGDGMGSLLVFAAGGQALSLAKIPSVVGTFMTTYAVSASANYEDALNLGMDTQQAAIASSIVSSVEASLEAIIPDSKYIDLTPVRRSIFAAVSAKKTRQEITDEIIKALPESLGYYLDSFGQESMEELTQLLGSNLAKLSIDAAAGTNYYKDTYDTEAIKETIIAGGMPGLAMAIIRRAATKMSPLENSIIGEAARMSPPQIESIYQKQALLLTDENQKAKLKEIYVFAQSKFLELNKDQNFRELPEAYQDQLIVAEVRKQFGNLSNEQISAIDEEIEQITDPEAKDQAILEERKATIKFSEAPENIEAGTTVEFDDPEQKDQAENFQPAVVYTPEAADLIVKASSQELSPEEKGEAMAFIAGQYKALYAEKQNPDRKHTQDEIEAGLQQLEDNLMNVFRDVIPQVTVEDMKRSNFVESIGGANQGMITKILNEQDVTKEQLQETLENLIETKRARIAAIGEPGKSNAAKDIARINAAIELVEGTMAGMRLPQIQEQKAEEEKQDNELTPPTPEQALQEAAEGKITTVEYDNEADIPEVWKNKVSSTATVDGKTTYRVSLPTSVFEYESKAGKAYDAKKEESNSEHEAKKADIERRRQEDLETTKNIGEDKLIEGRENTKKIVESLKQRYPVTSVKGIIIRILEKLIDFSKYSTIIDSNYINSRNASGQAAWFGMIISEETLDGILAGKEHEVHTFIHEFIHGFTTSKISDYNIEKQGLIPGFKSKLTAKEKNAIEQLQRIFEKVRRDNPKSKEYGFTNLDEFIAEAFSNSSFQYTLKNTKAEGKKSNLFSEFVNSIGDLLFEQLERWAKRFNKEIPQRNTITGILEDVLAWTEELIDQNNKLAYIATNDEINAKYDAELAALEREYQKDKPSAQENPAEKKKATTPIELIQDVKKANDIEENMFDAVIPLLDEVEQGENIPFVDDQAENDLINDRLEQKDNPEQEPGVKAIEGKAAGNNKAELAEAVRQIDQKIADALQVENIAMADINLDEANFQNRKGLIESTVKNIVDNFSKAQFNPVVLWRNPQDNKLYLLAGHHRHEAFRRMGKTTIPAVISEFATLEEAKYFAKYLSNNDRSMEMPYERADLYRQMRADGEKESVILERAKEEENSNAQPVINLSFINPQGLTMSALIQTSTANSDTRKEVQQVAEWVGNARRSLPSLTNAHEDEMYKFLVGENGKKMSNRNEFIERIRKIAGSPFFDPEKPLNLFGKKAVTPAEEYYETELARIEGAINERTEAKKKLNQRFDTPTFKEKGKLIPNPDFIRADTPGYVDMLAERDRALTKINQEIAVFQKQKLDLLQKKSTLLQGAKAQVNIFDAIEEDQKPAPQPKPAPAETPKKNTDTLAEFKKIGIKILEDNGPETLADWLANQPLLGGFEGIKAIANDASIKFPQTQKEFDQAVDEAGDVDVYMKELKFGEFYEYFLKNSNFDAAAFDKQQNARKKPQQKPTPPVEEKQMTEAEKKREELKAAMKKFLDTPGGTGGLMINPDKLNAGIEMVRIAVEMGIMKFKDLMSFMIDSFGPETAKNNVEAVKAAYAAYRETIEDEEKYDQFDDSKTVRSYKFPEVNEQNETDNQADDQPTAKDVITTADATIAKAKNTRGNKKNSGKVIDEIDEALEAISKQLALAGIYTIEGYDPDKDVHETGNKMPERKFKKDMTAFSKAISEKLGLEHDTDSKGKTIYTSVNVAPAGGDAHIILWKPNSNKGVYINVKVDRSYDDDSLNITGIYYRGTTKERKYTGGSNNWAEIDITADELANRISYLLAEKPTKPEEDQQDQPTPQEPDTKAETAARERKQVINRIIETIKNDVNFMANYQASDPQNKAIALDKKIRQEGPAIELNMLQANEINSAALDAAPLTVSEISEIENQINKDDERGNSGELGQENLDLPQREQAGNSKRNAAGGRAGGVFGTGGKSNTESNQDVDAGTQSDEQRSSRRDFLDRLLSTLNNYFPSDQDAVARQTFKKAERFKDNLAALEVLAQIEREARFATPQEQEVLAKYVGWGGLKEIIRDPNKPQLWDNIEESEAQRERVRRLYELVKELDPTGVKNIAKSIQLSSFTAFYTSYEVIDGIYDVLKKMGVKGTQQIFEPSAGIGNFFMRLPEDMRESEMGAVELDWISAKILKNLMQKAEVQDVGIEDAVVHEGYYDVVVGNVPFADMSINDREMKAKFKSMGKAPNNYIHNYSFMKAVEAARPGGLIALVTSTGTMDAKTASEFRADLMTQAKFLGAVRLPIQAFKGQAGTEVVSDIIFLQKLQPGEVNTTANDFIEVGSITLPTDKEKEGVPVMKTFPVNNYFVNNRGKILGTLSVNGIGDMLVNQREELSIREAIEQATGFATETKFTNVPISDKRSRQTLDDLLSFKKNNDYKPGNVVVMNDKLYAIDDDYAVNSENDKIAQALGINPNSIRDNHGAVTYHEEQKLESAGLKVTDFLNNKLVPIKINPKAIPVAKAYNRIRIAIEALVEAEYEGMSTNLVEDLRQRLNDMYDEFVFSHGPINDSDLARLVMKYDDSSPKVAALEIMRDGKYEKSDIFFISTVQAKPKELSANNAQDAITLTLFERGKFDLDRAAEIRGIEVEEFIREAGDAIFYDPALDAYNNASEYLSGNVVRKLDQAQKAGLVQNIAALEKVQPQFLTADEIGIEIGAPYIDKKYFEQYIDSMVNASNFTKIQINTDGSYAVIQAPGSLVNKVNGLVSAKRFAEAILNGNKLDVKDATTEQKEQLATAQRKARKEFQSWFLSNPQRAAEIAENYRVKIKNTVEKKYDEGVNIELPGLDTKRFQFRPHQKLAVYRFVQQQGGIMDHMVGAGKTLVIAAVAMEMRRTGVANKPLIIGLKAQVPQMAREFREAYPNSKVLIPKDDDFSPENRRKMLARIATNDWDAVIITHDQFLKIPQDPTIEAEIIQQEIDSLAEIITLTKSDRSQADELKNLLKQEQKLKERLENALSVTKDKGSFYFQQLGIDFLTVDESHSYKNLSFATKLSNIKGIGNPTGSKKTLALLAACRTIQQRRGADKGILFASGTPISNSLSELYLLFKYLRPTYLSDLGIKSFDGWANMFAQAETELENYMGRLKSVTRFRKFVNAPEMLMAYREIADVRNSLNLELPRPKANHHLIKCPASNLQKWIFERLNEYLELRGTEDAGLYDITHAPDQPYFSSAHLVVMTYAKKASLDPRLLNPKWGATPGGKIEKLVNQVYEIYQKWDEQKGTQLIFCDTGVPKGEDKVQNLYDFMAEMRYDMEIMHDVFGEEFASKSAHGLKLPAVREKLIKHELMGGMTTEEVGMMIDEAQKMSPFTVYQQVKDDLIAQGIKEEEIAFIHDYNGSVKRSQLYEKVNNGEIRVLLGGTQKLGVGVNVQKRLIAAHHLDIQWRFSDVEQRNGRIERQGNEIARDFNNNEVDIYFYATENSLDEYMYEMNNVKGRLAAAIKVSEINSRTIEDMDMELDLGEMAAELSNNQDVKRRSKVMRLISEMNAERASNISEKVRLEHDIDKTKTALAVAAKTDERNRRNKIVFDSALQRVEEEKLTSPYVVFDDEGKEFVLNRPSDLGAAIWDAWDVHLRSIKSGTRKPRTKYKFGTAYGFDMYIDQFDHYGMGNKLGSQVYQVTIETADESVLFKLVPNMYGSMVANNSDYAFENWTQLKNGVAIASAMVSQLTRKINNTFGDESFQKRKEYMDALQQNVDALQASIDKWKPWDKDNELAALEDEMRVLDSAIIAAQAAIEPTYLDKYYDGISEEWVRALDEASDELPDPDDDPDTDPSGPSGRNVDAQIDEATQSVDNTAEYEAAKEKAALVAKALRKINPKANFVFYATHEEFLKSARAQTKQNVDKWIAFHNPATGTMHFSIENMKSNTVFHEGLHPVLAEMIKHDEQVVNELFSQLENTPGAEAVVKWATKNYGHMGDRVVKTEAIIEFIAEMVDGKHADLLKTSLFDKIKNFFLKLINKLGIPIGTISLENERDLMSLAKKVNTAFKTGTRFQRIHGPAIRNANNIMAQARSSQTQEALEKIKYIIITNYNNGKSPETIANSLIASDKLRSFLDKQGISPMMFVAATIQQNSNPETNTVDRTVIDAIADRLRSRTKGKTRISARQARRELEYTGVSEAQAVADLNGEYTAAGQIEIERIAQEDFVRIADAYHNGNPRAIQNWVDAIINVTDAEKIDIDGFSTYQAMMMHKLIFFFRNNMNATGDPEARRTFIALERMEEQITRSNAQSVAAASAQSTPEAIVNAMQKRNKERDDVMDREVPRGGRKIGKVIEEMEEQGVTDEEIDEAFEKFAPQITKIVNKKTKVKTNTQKKEKALQKAKDAAKELRQYFSQANMGIPLNAIPAFNKMAAALVEAGYYSLAEIKETIWEQAFQGTKVSKDAVDEQVNRWWDKEGKQFRDYAQSAEAAASLLKGIAAKTSDKSKQSRILNQLIDTILSSDPEYAAAKNDTERMAAKERLAILLRDRTQLENVLARAKRIAEKSIDGSSDSAVQKAARKAELEDFVHGLLNSSGGISSTLIREAFRNGELEEASDLIKMVVKRHYRNHYGAAQSLAASLVYELGIDEEFAGLIESEMAKTMGEIIAAKRAKRIDDLIDELGVAANQKVRMRTMIIEVLSKGVGSSTEFKNAFGAFLGFRGVSDKDIQELLELQERVSKLPDNEVRIELVKHMNNITLKYEQNVYSYIGGALVQFLHINALSNIMKTAFMNAGVGALITYLPWMAYKAMIQPRSFARARSMRKALKNAGYSITGQTYKDFYSNPNVTYGVRELTDMGSNSKASGAIDRALQQDFSDMMADIKGEKNSEVKRVKIAMATVRVASEVLGSGKYNKISTVSSKIMGLTDLFLSSYASDMNYLLATQALFLNDKRGNQETINKAVAFLKATPEQREAMKMDPEIQNVLNFLEISAIDPDTLAEIDAHVTEEISIMTNAGEAIPQGFAERRRTQLRKELSVPAIMQQVEFEVQESLMMNKPVNLGAHVYKWQQGLMAMPPHISMAGMLGKFFASSLLMFSKTASNSAYTTLKGTPIGGLLSLMKEETRLDENNKAFRTTKDITIKNKDGKVIYKSNRRAYQLVSAMTAMSLMTMLLSYLFDYEEEIDEETGKVKRGEDGEPIMRIRLNPNNDLFTVHGDGPKYNERMGLSSGYVPNSIELKFVDNPSLKYITFNRLPPQLRPGLKLAGAAADRVRYKDDDEKQVSTERKPGEWNKAYDNPKDPLSIQALVINSAVYAFENDFSGYTNLVSDVLPRAGQEYDATGRVVKILEKAVVSPSKTVVSPKIYEWIEKELYAATSQEQWRSTNAVKQAVKGIWFVDPFFSINPDEEEFVLDHFGEPIFVQSDAKALLSTYHSDLITGTVKHVEESRLYRLYTSMNLEDGKKNLMPKDYVPSELKVIDANTGEEVSAKLSDKQKREVANQTRIEFGSIVRDNIELLENANSEERLLDLQRYHDVAKKRAVLKLNYIPNE